MRDNMREISLDELHVEGKVHETTIYQNFDGAEIRMKTKIDTGEVEYNAYINGNWVPMSRSNQLSTTLGCLNIHIAYGGYKSMQVCNDKKAFTIKRYFASPTQPEPKPFVIPLTKEELKAAYEKYRVMLFTEFVEYYLGCYNTGTEAQIQAALEIMNDDYLLITFTEKVLRTKDAGLSDMTDSEAVEEALENYFKDNGIA